MPATEKLTITLPLDAIDLIRFRVSSGEFANESEVIESLLMASILPPVDKSGLELWIATEGVRRYDEMRANPSKRLTSDEVFAELESDLTELPKAG